MNDCLGRYNQVKVLTPLRSDATLTFFAQSKLINPIISCQNVLQAILASLLPLLTKIVVQISLL